MRRRLLILTLACCFGPWWLSPAAAQNSIWVVVNGVATFSGPVNFAGGTMTGSILFSPTNTVDMGSSSLLPRSVYAGTSFLGPAGAATSGSVPYSFTADPDTGFYNPSANTIGVVTAASERFRFTAGSFQLLEDASEIRWGSSNDSRLAREGANYLIQRNSTSAQRQSWGGTYSSATNYSVFSVDGQTTATTWLIGSRVGSSGTAWPVVLNYGGVATAAITVPITSGNIVLGGGLTITSATMLTSVTTLTNGAAAQVATMTNGPSAGNPTKWIPINDNGTTRYIPSW